MSDSVEVAIQRAAAGAAATGPATPIVIKEDRSIVVPSAMQQIAVQCDNEANVLHFVCPRNWADIDLAAATLYINVVKPDKSTVAFVCTNVVSSEDTITFDWVVTEPVTDVVGKLSFLVCARDPSDPGNGYRWHSNLCDSLFIAPGIACVAPDDTPDPPHIPLYGTDTTLTEPHVPADAAAVGAQLSSLSEKITNLPQADWNQNDSTAADYVKNRPFYTSDPVETVLVEESTVAFTENEGLFGAEFSSTFSATVGETYKVSWDGSVYECSCVAVDEVPFPLIGNLSIIGLGSDTSEPFLIAVESGYADMIITADTSASHTFSISGPVTEVVKIDEKYLPDTVATKSDVAAAQRAASTANTAAKNAQTTANNAQTKANNAQTTANNAINAATGSVKFTVSQNLTDAQKKQARTNIGAGTSSFSGSYNDLTNKPTAVQSDWEVNNNSDAAYIKNRTHYDYTAYSQITFLSRPTASLLIKDIYYYGEVAGRSLALEEGSIYQVSCNNSTRYISTCKRVPVRDQPVGLTGRVLGNAKLGADAGYLDITNPNHPVTDADTGEPWCFISFSHTAKNAIISTISGFSINSIYVQTAHELKQLDEKYIPSTIQRVGDDLILSSSTEGSTKKFKITVDDSGTITATEV